VVRQNCCLPYRFWSTRCIIYHRRILLVALNDCKWKLKWTVWRIGPPHNPSGPSHVLPPLDYFCRTVFTSVAPPYHWQTRRMLTAFACRINRYKATVWQLEDELRLATTWIPSPPLPACCNLNQNLTRSSVGANEYLVQDSSTLVLPFMRYRGNKICPDELSMSYARPAADGWVTTYVDKPSATRSANQANSTFHPFEVDKWVVSCNRMCATSLRWMLTEYRQDGSFHPLINVWVAGKTVISASLSQVPFLSALEVVYDDALNKSTFTWLLLYFISIEHLVKFKSCALEHGTSDKRLILPTQLSSRFSGGSLSIFTAPLTSKQTQEQIVFCGVVSSMSDDESTFGPSRSIDASSRLT